MEKVDQNRPNRSKWTEMDKSELKWIELIEVE